MLEYWNRRTSRHSNQRISKQTIVWIFAIYVSNPINPICVFQFSTIQIPRFRVSSLQDSPRLNQFPRLQTRKLPGFSNLPTTLLRFRTIIQISKSWDRRIRKPLKNRCRTYRVTILKQILTWEPQTALQPQNIRNLVLRQIFHSSLMKYLWILCFLLPILPDTHNRIPASEGSTKAWPKRSFHYRFVGPVILGPFHAITWHESSLNADRENERKITL